MSFFHRIFQEVDSKWKAFYATVATLHRAPEESKSKALGLALAAHTTFCREIGEKYKMLGNQMRGTIEAEKQKVEFLRQIWADAVSNLHDMSNELRDAKPTADDAGWEEHVRGINARLARVRVDMTKLHNKIEEIDANHHLLKKEDAAAER